jgi:hypothetical protein
MFLFFMPEEPRLRPLWLFGHPKANFLIDALPMDVYCKKPKNYNNNNNNNRYISVPVDEQYRER